MTRRPRKALRKGIYDGRSHGPWGSAGLPYFDPTQCSYKIPCKPSSAAWETVYALRATVDMGDLSERKGSPASRVRDHRRQEYGIHAHFCFSFELVNGRHTSFFCCYCHTGYMQLKKRTNNKQKTKKQRYSCSGPQICPFQEEKSRGGEVEKQVHTEEE